MRPFLLSIAVAVACLSMAGCPSGGGPVGDLPGPGETISLSRDVQPIFSAHCGTCHTASGGATLFDGIRIRLTDADAAFETLVNQLSVQDARFTLVVPGDPDGSLLALKITDANPPVGERMPFLARPLSDDEIRVIRGWIGQGAARN